MAPPIDLGRRTDRLLIVTLAALLSVAGAIGCGEKSEPEVSAPVTTPTVTAPPTTTAPAPATPTTPKAAKPAAPAQ
ncbi:MAG: LPS translocon maturation chaperone LptM [Solirubrobacterales bacterium]